MAEGVVDCNRILVYSRFEYVQTEIVTPIARNVGDENAPRPRSRHSRKKEGKVNENGGRSSNGNGRSSDGIVTKKRMMVPEVDDPLLKEFLDVMLRGKSKMWSNDISTAEVASKEKVLVSKVDDPVVSNGVERKKANSDDVLNTGRLFVHNLPYTTTEDDLRDDFSKFGEISEVRRQKGPKDLPSSVTKLRNLQQRQ